MTDVPEDEPTPDVAPCVTTGPDAEGEQVMNLLAEHVPLALLVDLITPEGPASADILRSEGMPDDAWWEPDDDAAATGSSDRGSADQRP